MAPPAMSAASEPPGRQRRDDLLLHSFALENPSDRRFPQKVTHPRFVFVVARQNAPLVFERVPERNMRDVVQQRGDANQPFRRRLR